MRNRSLYLLKGSLILFDLFILNGCYWFAIGILDTFSNRVPRLLGFHQYWAICNIIWLLCTLYFKLYKSETNRSMEKNFIATIKSLVSHALLLTAFFVFTQQLFISKFLVFFYLTLVVVFTVSRFIMTIIDNLYRRSFKNKPAVAVMGYNSTGIRLANYFKEQKPYYQFKGILDETETLSIDTIENLRNSIRRGIQQAVALEVQEVYAAVPPEMMHEVRRLMEEAERSFIRLKLVPDMSSIVTASFQMNQMDAFTVVTLRKEPLDNMGNRLIKRLFDLIFSVLVIVFLLSWLYPIIAIFIKLQSPGPTTFKQLRSGRNNKSFWCYKFRSMKVNAESDSKQASRNDSRITTIGAFLRKTNLDELPQFFNVFKGEMSVVGPRPHMLAHTEQYKAIIDTYMARHFLKPGITGWAQVTGYRGETKDPSLMAKRVEKDIYYLENWSTMFDIKIIFLTVFMAVKGDENAF